MYNPRHPESQNHRHPERSEGSQEIRNTDKPDGTMKKLTDVTKLNSLGWQYKMDLESGIKEMYAWYKDSIR